MTFLRDIRSEWNYGPPSRHTSRVWVRVWQDWQPAFKAGPRMRRYVMILLFPADLIDRARRSYAWARKLGAFQRETQAMAR